jgi:hypothetical protein
MRASHGALYVACCLVTNVLGHLAWTCLLDWLARSAAGLGVTG